VDPPLQPVEVGLFPSMGSMVPQPYAAGGNRSNLGVLGHNRRLMVPKVNYPTVAPEPSVERVAGAGHSMVGGTGSHMVL
jgi:hypothetical protein